MSKPTIQSINVKLEKHIAVSDERWVETILRIKRIEAIMIGTAGTTIVLLIGLLVR
tara:strand:+ start:345 stop:512 length:168 start_codon:yes stop_codon:yes gene_type:complete